MNYKDKHLSQRLRSTSTVAVITAALLLSPLFIGCDAAQDSTVSGRVTIDGKPLDHGSVFFTNAEVSASAPASGQIRSDGSYEVQIGRSGEMVAGEYSVVVSMRSPSIPSPEGGPPTPGQLLTPAKYANTSTSGLRYQVRAGRNIIDIALSGEGTEEAVVTPEAKDPAAEIDSVKETASNDLTEVEEIGTDGSDVTESNE